MTKYEEKQFRLRVINEVARYIMGFADYSTIDTFHIPLDIMKSLINGIIPYEKEDSEYKHKIKEG